MTVRLRSPGLTALVAAIGLVGCEAGEPPAPEAPVEEAGPSLGGIDLSQPLRLIGTEPFWAVDITADSLVLTGVDIAETRAPNPTPVVQGTTATWTSEAAGEAFVVTLVETQCSDGMSDRTYPLTARVEVGETTYTGCGAATEWFETTDETGQPR